MEKTDDKKKEPAAPQKRDEANWSHDIENRDYYYDDSTGYEVYQPDDDEESEEAAEEAEPAAELPNDRLNKG